MKLIIISICVLIIDLYHMQLDHVLALYTIRPITISSTCKICMLHSRCQVLPIPLEVIPKTHISSIKCRGGLLGMLEID